MTLICRVIDNKQFAHQKYSIGQRAAVLPRFGRIPSKPTMPQMQQIQNPGSMGLYMGLAQAGMSAASTFAQFSPKGPDLKFGEQEGFDSYLDKLMAEPYNPLGGSQVLMEQIQYDPRVNVDIGQPLEAPDIEQQISSVAQQQAQLDQQFLDQMGSNQKMDTQNLQTAIKNEQVISSVSKADGATWSVL